MSNTNRDYLIICDVKNSKITINRPIKFYVTDKNTSNIFIRLVTQIAYDSNINKYVDIEPASNYSVVMRIVKPNNEIKNVVASRLEEGAMYQVDLQDDCKDIPGMYKCELLIGTIVKDRLELNTSDMFTYKVERSIISNIDEIIETEDTTVEDLLNRVDAVSLQINNKVNRGEGGVITNAMLSQEVREAMTGGSVPVVGVNTILEPNIVDGQVTHRKLGNDVLKFQDVNLITNVGYGYFINWNDGSLTENVDYVYTDFIRISPLNNLYCKVTTHYALYDGNKNFIKGVQGVIDNNIVTQEIEVPSNAYYIRLSTRKKHEENFILSTNRDFLNNQNYIIKNELNGRKIILDGEWIIHPNQIKEKVINSKHVDSSIFTLIKGKNKFNPKKIIDNKFVDWNDGSFKDNVDYFISDYIDLYKGQELRTNVTCHIAFYDSDKIFISGFKDTERPSTIIAPENCRYVVLSVSKANANVNNFMVTIDEELGEFEEFCYKINEEQSHSILKAILSIADNVITSRNVDDTICTFIKGKNKFNAKTIADGMFINWFTGNLQENVEYVTSDYIKVYEGQQIRQTFLTHYAFYDKNMVFIIGNRNTDTPDPFIVPSGAKYIRVSIKKTAFDYTKYMLTLDEELGEFEEFCYKINEEQGKVILESAKQETGNNSPVSRFYGKKVSWYGTSITQGYGWCELVNKYFNFNATNNGVGGTAICKENENSSMCTQNRMLGKYSSVTDPNTGQVTLSGTPIPTDVEVIFVEGGTNDWARNWVIGDKEFSENPNDQTFAGACHLMFKNLTTLFPNAEIIVVGSPFGKLKDRNVFNNKYGVLNNQNLQTIEYGDILLEIAGKWGIKGFNMGREMQIHDNNIATLIPDGLHFSTTEAKQMASNVIINYLLTLN